MLYYEVEGKNSIDAKEKVMEFINAIGGPDRIRYIKTNSGWVCPTRSETWPVILVGRIECLDEPKRFRVEIRIRGIREKELREILEYCEIV